MKINCFDYTIHYLPRLHQGLPKDQKGNIETYKRMQLNIDVDKELHFNVH